jgi:hypothetical protein
MRGRPELVFVEIPGDGPMLRKKSGRKSQSREINRKDASRVKDIWRGMRRTAKL